MAERSEKVGRRIRMVTWLCPALLVLALAIAGSRRSTTAAQSLDHFTCYSMSEQSVPRFARRSVTLTDQFGTSTALVLKPSRLCKPAGTDGEGIADPIAHLMCYRIKEPRAPKRSILIHNQLGDQAMVTKSAESLCLPAEIGASSSAAGAFASSAGGAFLNHYKCYKARAKGFPSRSVVVADGFGSRTVTVVKPALFCNPVDKNGEGITGSVGGAFLPCYKVKPGKLAAPINVTVADQFATQDGRTMAGRIRRLSLLCVPSEGGASTPTTTIPGTATTTTLLPLTCSLGSPPTCGGTCLPGTTCQVDPVLGLACLCLPSVTVTTLPLPTCSLGSPPTCGGTCLPGTTCQVDPVGGLACVCLPPVTVTTLPLPTCSLASPPTCGGTCPPGTTCRPDSVLGVACLCLP